MNRIAVAAAVLLTTVAAGAITRAGQDEQRYFVVNGPDYRPVTSSTFSTLSCTSQEVKTYPSDRVVVHICYL